MKLSDNIMTLYIHTVKAIQDTVFAECPRSCFADITVTLTASLKPH